MVPLPFPMGHALLQPCPQRSVHPTAAPLFAPLVCSHLLACITCNNSTSPQCSVVPSIAWPSSPCPRTAQQPPRGPLPLFPLHFGALPMGSLGRAWGALRHHSGEGGGKWPLARLDLAVAGGGMDGWMDGGRTEGEGRRWYVRNVPRADNPFPLGAGGAHLLGIWLGTTFAQRNGGCWGDPSP